MFLSLSNEAQRLPRERRPWPGPLRLAGLGFLFVLGMAVILIVDWANKLGLQGAQFIANAGLVRTFCYLVAGFLVSLLLLRRPEIALGLFFLVGLVKGDPSLSSAPVDLTVLVGVIVQVTVCYRVFIKRQTMRLPEEYFFYVPLLGMMIVSLTYAPNLAGGLDKLLRFVCLT